MMHPASVHLIIAAGSIVLALAVALSALGAVYLWFMRRANKAIDAYAAMDEASRRNPQSPARWTP